MIDLLWTVATSDIALMAGGGFVAVAGIVSLLPARWMPPQLAGVVMLARPAAIGGLFCLGVAIGHRLADGREALRNAKFELEWKENELEQQKKTAEEAAELANRNKQRAEALQTKVDDYVEELSKKPVGVCAFDDDDLARLRAIGTPRGKQRSNPARLRKSGG